MLTGKLDLLKVGDKIELLGECHRNFNFFFFNDTATTENYTLSLHDALPISMKRGKKNGFQIITI